MTSSAGSIRRHLVDAAEQCYYSGPTAGQMWLHDLSAYLQTLPEDDGRLRRLAGAATDATSSAQQHLCEEPHPLAQAFSPSDWLDRYVERFA